MSGGNFAAVQHCFGALCPPKNRLGTQMVASNVSAAQSTRRAGVPVAAVHGLLAVLSRSQARPLPVACMESCILMPSRLLPKTAEVAR